MIENLSSKIDSLTERDVSTFNLNTDIPEQENVPNMIRIGGTEDVTRSESHYWSHKKTKRAEQDYIVLIFVEKSTHLFCE